LGYTGVGVIAEIKRRSPTAGTFAAEIDPVHRAQTYSAGGAIAISVLTDEPYFGGSHHDLQTTNVVVDLPIIQKDFVIDDYQIYEAAAYGADAVLLIAGLSSHVEPSPGPSVNVLRHQIELAEHLHLDALVEIHTDTELEEALRAGARIIGVNNRNLQNFTTDIAVTEALCELIPSEIVVVSESGMHTAADIARAGAAGVDGVLVGEALMTLPNPIEHLRTLVATGKRSYVDR
jgi:indole-3-glycerol phosphate synthase